jgi:hypothetical protein
MPRDKKGLHSMRTLVSHRLGAAGIAISLASIMAIPFASGCSRSGLVKVRGRVTYADGSPVPLGRVVIDSGDSPTGAWGRIKSDGRFTLGTLKESDGIAPGNYRVAILDANTAGGPEGPGKRFVDDRFTDYATSGLEFRVPDQTDWQITVEPPKKDR